MAQGPSDTILVAIRITLWIRESKVRNPDLPDRRRFVLSEHSFLVILTFTNSERPLSMSCPGQEINSCWRHLRMRRCNVQGVYAFLYNVQ